MERYDIAIIGTGPAGISAAITATIRNKNVLLLGDKNLSIKIEKAHLIENYPGFPEMSGEQFKNAMLEHLIHLGIEITQEKVKAVYNMGDYFAIQGTHDIYESATVILSTGVNFVGQIPGEKDVLGHGVSYCATCDAVLYRNKSVIVVGYYAEAVKEAEFLSEIVGEIRYLPLHKESVVCDIDLIRGKPLQIMKRDDEKVVLVTEKEEYVADGVFILRDCISPGQLIGEIEMNGNHVVVDLQMKSNIAGCFACGDITGKPYQYIKAAGQGNVAALSAVEYIQKRGK